MSNLLPDTIRPVVVVPGILGCWPPALAPRGKVDPLTRIYDNLLDALRTIGFVDGVSLFIFSYDWRQEVDQTGAYLGHLISDIRKQGQGGRLTKKGSPYVPGQGQGPFNQTYTGPKVDYSKVDIIAHSLGGLVARGYIQSNDSTGDVARYFGLSVPHRGAISAYYAVEGGDTTKIGVPVSAAKAMIAIARIRETGNFFTQIFDYIKLARGQYPVDLFQEINNAMPGVRGLLPCDTGPYVYTLENGNERFEACGPTPGYPVNNVVARLNEPTSLEKLAQLEEMWSLTSGSYPTRCRVQVQARGQQAAPLWDHGEPLQDQPPQNFQLGDTLVTPFTGRPPLEKLSSGSLAFRLKHYTFQLDKEIDRKLNHVEVCYEAAAVRFVAGCLLSQGDGIPRKIGPEVWDKPSPDPNKINYPALFL